jgi:hypothetical protein
MPENADDLLAAAANKTTSEIEELLAERFPHAEMPAVVKRHPESSPLPDEQLSPGPTAGAEDAPSACRGIDRSSAPGDS